MTSPFPIDAPELFSVGTEAIVDRAKHLGLTWTKRMATVVDCTDPAAATVLFDADTVNQSAVSMVGLLGTGTRVYVDMIPPGGNFIVGVADDLSGPVNFVSSTSSTGAITVETTVLTSGSIIWRAGRAYSVAFSQETTPSVVNSFVEIVVRRTTGSVLLLDNVFPLPILVRSNCQATGFVRNNTSGDITDSILLRAIAGAGNITGFGSATNLRWLEVREVGASASYTNAVQI